MQPLAPGVHETMSKSYCLAMEGNGVPWVCDLEKGHDGLHSGPNRLGFRLQWGLWPSTNGNPRP